MTEHELRSPDDNHPQKKAPAPPESGEDIREPDDYIVAARCPFPIVGVGASAGGLEALASFVKPIREDSGMAYVLILHLDPSKASQLASILGRETRLPVLNVEDGLTIEPNHVYVCVPDRDITIADGAFRLDKQIRNQGPPHPIDVFLNSLAQHQANLAAAGILSGTGSDGSHGIKTINHYGGIVLAQDPETARFRGMPSAIIASGLTDFVLPPEAMAEMLSRYFDNTTKMPPLESVDASDRLAVHLAKILDAVRSNTGYDFSGYKPKMLLRRIRRRMGLADVTSLERYCNDLTQNTKEMAALVDDFLIGVTGFFRDPAAWETLDEHVIRPLIRDSAPDQKLRVWVLGCASGEEAYSIAILLAERRAEAKKPLSINVFATDVSTGRLTRARQALFPLTIGVEVSQERLDRFFSQDDHGYRLTNEIRDMVVFAPHNMLNDPPFSRMDLILCRNVLIYLDNEIQKQLISLFHFSLREGGYLFLGSAETLGRTNESFDVISRKWKIYRRVGPTRHGIINFPLLSKAKRAPIPTQDPRQGKHSIANILSTALLERFAPPSALVDRKYRVRFLHGDTSRYLKLPSGEPTSDLTMLARERLRGPIRRAVADAAETGQTASIDVQLKKEEPGQTITVTAQPLRRRNAPEELFVVIFHERGAAPEEHGGGHPHVAGSEKELEEQLQAARDELYSVIEDLEASNEELKASNEEVTSVNEELQATNEEMETSQEELQSLNEELNFVNNQLYTKIDELEKRSDDLRNLLASTDVATIFLDSEFRIRWFTPTATKLFQIIPADVNRPIDNFAQNFHDDALLSDARKVLESLSPSEKEVESHHGDHYMRRILPYRTQDNRIGGIVITFIDITQQKTALQATEQARRYAENIVDTIGYPLMVLDQDLRVRSANAGFYDVFNLTPDHVVGKSLHELGGGEWDIQELRQAVGQRDDGERDLLVDCEVEREFPAIGKRVLCLNARRIQQTGLTLLAIDDLTERKKSEEGEKLLLMELEHRVKNILQNVHALLRDARNRSKTVPELYEALASRIDALARTQEMLANCGQRQIEIRSLISQEAMAHAAEVGQNLFLDGPPLQLMPKAAQVLAMAIHELATNAFKFGALSKAEGRVEVSWRMKTTDSPSVVFQWKEAGISITGERPRSGFGTEFIVKGLPFMLGGTATLEFERDGVLCAVTFPATGNVPETQW